MAFHRTLKTQLVLAVIVLSGLILTGCGITAKSLHNHEGYADIESPWWWQADKQTSISIGPSTIRAARWFTDIDKDPQVKALLKSVDGIRLLVYKVDHNSEVFKGSIEQTRENLTASGWFPVVQVKDKDTDETKHIFMKSDGNIIDGLVVLSLSETKATFVNVIGDIHPDDFEPLMSQVTEIQ